MITVLSLGAGVQSSTLALMAAHGEIEPMPDVAIFADTGWEPKAVYDWLDWLEKQLPFPVERVDNGNLRERMLKFKRRRDEKDELKGRSASIPMFTLSNSGKRGMLPRQCTSEHKINPVHKKLRELIGLNPRQRAPREPVIDLWLGISLDEMQRMRESTHKFYRHRFPLIDHRIRRLDCIQWMGDNGYPTPPRSACVGCPYHSDDEWRNIKADPVAWDDAVSFERELRAAQAFEDDVFLHASRVPLGQVDLSTAADHGQLSFLDECEGMCGV